MIVENTTTHLTSIIEVLDDEKYIEHAIINLIKEMKTKAKKNNSIIINWAIATNDSINIGRKNINFYSIIKKEL